MGGALALAFKLEKHVTGRMAGRRVDLDEIVEPIRTAAHQIGAPVLEDRDHAFAERAQFRRAFLRIGIDFREIVDVRLGKDIARVGEGRNPFPVLQLCIPADMVPMEMRAHHIVDLLGLDSDPGEIRDERGTYAVELRPRRPLLVVAEASIDQDRVPPGAHDEAVKAEDQFAGRGIDEARTQQLGVGAHHSGIEIGKEIARVEKRTLVIGDAGDLEIADADGLHLSSLARCEDRVRSSRL